MEEKIYRGYLYDFYGQLLNEHQREVYELYVVEDLSFSEIAEINGTSRQGAHDLVKRCTKSLENYESKLKLVERFMTIKNDVNRINNLTQADDVNESILKEIADISSRILEEL